MSDFLTSNTMLMLQRSMNFQWTKQTVISDNIVNAETPNYKTKYVTFEEALRNSLQAAARGEGSVAAMRSALSCSAPTVRVAEEETTRMDGNGVNVAEQSVELVRNAYQLQHTYRAMSSDISRLLMAIRGQ
ncbi:MAG: flagellar basal body rod protein FlgB [Oscillospiraceae bacterium]|jgi:flagellar basal-body rod protein FlgB|nr:flagellar basal body rod protein FlgB [Oscillospiraceae bacterium]